MSSSVIGALRANLGLDSAQFESGSKKAQSSMDRLKSKFAIGGAAMAASVVAAGAAMTAFALSSAQAIDKTAKGARKIGETFAGLRVVELAAGEAGVEVTVLTDSLQTMNRELAKGGKGSASALKQLGIDAEAFKKQRPSEQLVTLADAIKDTGATSGEAAALLQQLGIRNKDMVLALVSGGDAIRAAAKDIKDYGLAMSDVDSGAIETANDQIGRLSLVGKYLGDQLAITIVPALGRMAQAFTDSLREGGLLRAVIDGLVSAVRVAMELFSATANIVGSFARVIADAAVWVWDITGGFFGLGEAISQTWGMLTAVVTWAYDLITGFSDLITAAGSFGDAMGMLGDTAVAVWQGIIDSAAAIPPALNGVWAQMQGGFLKALSNMATKFHDFVWTIGNGMSKVPGLEGAGASLLGLASSASAVSGSLHSAGQDAEYSSAASYAKSAGIIKDAFAPAAAAVQAMKDKIAGSKAELEGMNAPIAGVTEGLENAGGKGGGGAAKAAKGIKGLKDAVEEAAKVANRGADAIGGLFTSLLDGSKSLKQGIKDLILEIAKMQMMQAVKGLFGAGGALSGVGSFIGKLIGANAAGTNHWQGGLTRVHERGGEIMDLPAGTRIIPHDVSNRMAANSGGGNAVQVIGGDLTLTDSGAIMARVKVIAANTTQAGLTYYDRWSASPRAGKGYG